MLGFRRALLALSLTSFLAACSSGVLPPGPLVEVSGTITNAAALNATNVQLVTIGSAALASTGIDANGNFKLGLPNDSQIAPYLTTQFVCGKEFQYAEGYTRGASSSKTYNLRLSNYTESDLRKPGDQRMLLAFFGSTIELDCVSGNATLKGKFVKGWNAMLITYTGSDNYTVSSDPIPSSLTWRLE